MGYTLNFDRFLASAEYSADLGETIRDDSLSGIGGYVFNKSLYISTHENGKFHLLIERSEWIGGFVQMAEILWSAFYLMECVNNPPMLGNGTHELDLDAFIRGACGYHRIDCCGDEMGIIFSDGNFFSVQDAWQRIIEHAEQVRKIPCDAETIAAHFRRLMRKEIGHASCVAVDKENHNLPQSICASHDYCDANMVMLAAFEAVGIKYKFDDETTAIANDAWNIAKRIGFANK